MGTGGINQTTKNELIMALRQRYLKATKIEKTKILDEFTALAKILRLALPSPEQPPALSMPANYRLRLDKA